MAKSDSHALRDTARLLASLLLFELNSAMSERLNGAELRASLQALDLHPPSATDPDALESLAVEYFETFVQPRTQAPLIQSLWLEGSYEGECAARVRQLAKAGDFEFDRELVRGAPPDHLGCLLLLWADADAQVPELAREIERNHLRWALPGLRAIAAGEGFYGRLAAVVSDFLQLIAPTEVGSEAV